MSNVSCAAFKTQIAAIMDVLAKAAIAEISKLVEDDHVLVRLEMCRRENEIATLKKRLILTEMDLKNAQRAATRMPTERVSVATQVESSEDEYQHVIHTLEEAIPKAEGKISIEEPVRPASFPLNGDREILQNVTNSVPTGEDDRSISDFPMKREQDSGSSTLPECQYRSKDMYSQSDDQTNKLLQSWPAFDEANCQEEYPGCSYNTDLNSSSEANLFSVANNDGGTGDFPDDLQLDLFNSVSVKEEDVSMSVSQDFLNTIAQTKDGHLKESVNTSTVSSMGQSDPRVEKSSSSFSHSINVPPIASSHGTASFLPTDSQSQPTQPTLGALIHRPTTTQVSPQSQALSVMHVPYTQGRHLLTRPRTPGLMHRRAGVGIGMGHTSHHRVFICSLCGKSFPRFCQLEAHQSSHSGVKPYRCTECGKRFTQKTRLKTHQSVHTGERPFSCRLCGKRFNRQDNCLRHERFHRAKNPSSRLGLGRGLSN